METYKRLGIAPTSGRGSWLFDDEGNRYLDFIAGIATNSLGHGHPALVQAIQEQAEKLIHCSNLYEIPIQTEVAGLLTGATDFDRVFFCNSGTESVEAAIKLSRKHASAEHGPEKHEILSFSRSFHGRTYGGLSATAQPAMQEGRQGAYRPADGGRPGRADPGRERRARAARGVPAGLAGPV
jgi:acetylornithine/succinyldiaminopimelate/putrescine aminotransferase